VTLRTQLTLGFTLVALLGVGATGALLINSSFRHAMRQIQREQLLLAENRAGAISAEVAAEVERLRHISTLSELDLTDANREPEKAVLQHARTLPRYFTVETSAVAPDGTVLWTEPPPGSPAQEQSVAAAPWFADARSRRDAFVTEDPGPTHAIRARLVVPLWRASGTFAGALSTTLDPTIASRWSEKLQLDLGRSGTAELIDREGHVVSARGATGQVSDPAREEALSGALSGQVVSRFADDGHGRSWLVSAVPISSIGWALLTRQAADELDDSLDPELRALALLLGLGAAFALVLGIIFSRALARPLVALARTAREVERGHLEAVPSPRRGGELGDLERAFFSMTATLDARVRERTAALEKAQAELVEQGRFAAMGKTAAAIAHELKNSLNGLGTAIELLLQRRIPEAAQEALREQVRHEVSRLRDITDNLGLFGAAPRLNLAPQEVRFLVERAMAMLADRIASGAVEVSLVLPATLPPVPCDGLKIQGLLINLLKNAVEAVEPQVDQSSAGGAVEVRAQVVGEVLEIEIADSGPGLSPEVTAHLFEPFFTTKRTGTGLGLAIARRIALAHGGELIHRARVPHGSAFTLRLPLLPRGISP
jgi:signal transduction histidine kinase